MANLYPDVYLIHFKPYMKVYFITKKLTLRQIHYLLCNCVLCLIISLLHPVISTTSFFFFYWLSGRSGGKVLCLKGFFQMWNCTDFSFMKILLLLEQRRGELSWDYMCQCRKAEQLFVQQWKTFVECNGRIEIDICFIKFWVVQAMESALEKQHKHLLSIVHSSCRKTPFCVGFFIFSNEKKQFKRQRIVFQTGEMCNVFFFIK